MIVRAKLIRGCDSTREDSLFGGWWIDSALFDRFRSATSGLPAGQREAKIKAFMRARSAVSEDWSNMAAIAELRLPSDSRTPALVGKAHYQRLITDPKHPDYVPNVFLMGGDLQFYICIRERGWIKPMPVIREPWRHRSDLRPVNQRFRFTAGTAPVPPPNAPATVSLSNNPD